MIFVVDTSVAVKWFVNEPGRPMARNLLATEEKRIAPDLLVAEVANVLWRRQRMGDVEQAQLEEAVRELPSFFDELVPSSDLVGHAVQLARQLQHSVYDCIFLALASRQADAHLVTADSKFIEKAATVGLQSFMLPLSHFSSTPED